MRESILLLRGVGLGLARVSEALPPGVEPTAWGELEMSYWPVLPPVVRTRVRDSNPAGSASETRASAMLRSVRLTVAKFY